MFDIHQIMSEAKQMWFRNDLPCDLLDREIPGEKQRLAVSDASLTNEEGIRDQEINNCLTN